MRISLCVNCLETGAVPLEIGPTKGHQMDPYRETIDLCDICTGCLISGNLPRFAERNTSERTITVGAQGER